MNFKIQSTLLGSVRLTFHENLPVTFELSCTADRPTHGDENIITDISGGGKIQSAQQ